MTEAETITRALGGEWHGGSGLAACPICQPERRRDQRALSISDSAGRLLVHCHKSGCAVLPELRRQGIAQGLAQHRSAPDPAEAELRRAKERHKEAQRLRSAHALFAAGVSCEGTPAQSYLEARGIHGLRFAKMRHTLRFHPGALHTPSGLHLPAMLAQIRGPKGEALGVTARFFGLTVRAKRT